ncbi:MAG: hypothetical protein ACRDWG_14225 [Actinomycetes bacterium]
MAGALRRMGAAGLALLAVATAVALVLAPPERCPAVTTADLRAAATNTVNWFVRNQQPDGAWLYEYNRDTARTTPDYSVVRHSGVVMGLYRAASAGIPGAMELADRGLAWSSRRLVERNGWAAISYGGQIPVGAVALLTAGLAERRIETGDTRYDDLLRRLGQFLVAQTQDSGAVLARYDPGLAGPVPGEYSKYYTGEAYYALARLHTLFPNGGWGAVADRIGAYLATRRDQVEDYWPPLPDHWAAYGLAETVSFDERTAAEPLTEDELAYARRQAGLFSDPVRWVSQQAGPWGRLVRGSRELRGGGYGSIGEALTGLWVVASADERMTDLRARIAQRATCIAGLAVHAQNDSAEADRFREPGRVQGAWFSNGVTRMDDQRHALSALLRAIPIVEASAASDAGVGRQAPPVSLLIVALVTAVNPARAAFGVPRRDRSTPDAPGLAALGGLIALGGVLVAALLANLYFDATGVSEAALRIGAGVVGGVAGVVALVRRPPSPEPALPGWRAALVPVAVPLLASPAVVMLAVSAYADRGTLVVAGAVAIAIVVLIALVRGVPPDGSSGRILRWIGALTGALLTVSATLLVIDGLFSV